MDLIAITTHSFPPCLDICIAVLTSNEIAHTDMCWGESLWVVLVNMHMVLWRGVTWPKGWAETFWRGGSGSRCTSRVSSKWGLNKWYGLIQKEKVEQRGEWEIYSFSFIWHGSFVILWYFIRTFCFRPLGSDWSAQWDLLYVSESIRFDISWFNIEESISGRICHFEAQTQFTIHNTYMICAWFIWFFTLQISCWWYWSKCKVS